MEVTPKAPAEFAQIASLIGDEAFFVLVEAFGGTRVFIPQTLNRRHPVAEAIGWDALVALSAAFAGQHLTVPVARSWRVQVYSGRGMTRQQIARALQMSERGVFHILGRIRTNDAQLALDLNG